jgi:glycosyltransferase involved in cell wall biosynthesis
MSSLPKILLVGGPDVDARLELMHSLSSYFEIGALGSLPNLYEKFVREGFGYDSYILNRGANPLTDLKTLLQLISIFRKFKPQIVHTFDTKPCVWGRLAARFAGVPVVIGTLPGLGSLYVNESLGSRIVRSIYQGLQRLTCRVSDLTMFQNQDDAQQFIKSGIVASQKARVIPGSGIDTNLFSAAQVNETTKIGLKAELKIQSDEIVITMISRIIRTKGVLDFMQSALEMHKNNPKLHFLLVGEEDHESIDRLSAEEICHLKQAVNWSGPRNDIPAILATTDIFVLPSTYREGIPRVLLEAASMELPIITTNSPGCKEVVENEMNGFLIPAHNTSALTSAIRRLAEAPELRQRFGQVSRQRAVHEFDISVISGQIRDVYQHFIS